MDLLRSTFIYDILLFLNWSDPDTTNRGEIIIILKSCNPLEVKNGSDQTNPDPLGM